MQDQVDWIVMWGLLRYESMVKWNGKMIWHVSSLQGNGNIMPFDLIKDLEWWYLFEVNVFLCCHTVDSYKCKDSELISEQNCEKTPHGF